MARLKGLLWQSENPSEEPNAALVVRAKCSGGECLLVFFTLRGRRLVAIVPPQPSPFCILASSNIQEIIERILSGLGFTVRYRQACIVSSRLIRDTVEDTLATLADYEIIIRPL